MTEGWPDVGLVRILALALIVVLSIGAALAVRGAGRWLVVSDPLEKVGPVFVLGGRIPFRAMEAARLYAAGWATEVWLKKTARHEGMLAMERLGIEYAREEMYNRKILDALGVPADRVFLLQDTPLNTRQELSYLVDELRRRGVDRVILVTSKAHSRRVRTIWRLLADDSPRAIVRYSTEDPFDPDHWWRHTDTVKAVTMEIFALLNARIGFPLRPLR